MLLASARILEVDVLLELRIDPPFALMPRRSESKTLRELSRTDWIAAILRWVSESCTKNEVESWLESEAR